MARTTLITGIATPKDLTRKITYEYPLIRQERLFLDVVITSSERVPTSLVEGSSQYGRARQKLLTVVERAIEGAASNTPAFSLKAPDTDDSWAIDLRGQISLLLSKETHQRLGVIGEKCSVGSRSDSRFQATNLSVVRMDLSGRDAKALSRAKATVKRWDEMRASEGLLDWDVVYHTKLFPDEQVSTIKPVFQTRDHVCIPSPTIRPKPKPSDHKADTVFAAEQWFEDMHALFEWVGMASLGSDRLLANDRADPYVAVYECPSPSHTGSVTHVRFDGDDGFLPSEFLDQVIDEAFSSLLTANTAASCAQRPFVAITAQIHPDAQASYAKSSNQNSPIKIVKCWSLLATRCQPSSEGIATGEDGVSDAHAQGLSWVRAVAESY